MDNKIFDEYINSYSASLTRLCVLLCGDKICPDDLYQETWLKAMRFYDKHKPYQSFGYPVVIIEGKTDGEYLSSTNFMLYIEKNTGIVMKFESYNASGNLVHYTEIKDITINKNVTKNKDELEKYLNEKSKDYDDADKLRKEQAVSE